MSSHEPSRVMRQTTMCLTVGALIFIIGGALGWTVSKSVGAPFGHFTGAPIPWEIGVGIVAAIAAAFCWRSAFSTR